MTDQNFIQFKRKRDLGAILSDTFKFLSVEWKPFFITILRVAIIPILIAICAMIYYVMMSTSLFGSLSQTSDINSFSDINFSALLLPMIVFFFSIIIAYSLITASALSYIKSYIANSGIVNYEDISNLTKEKFWPYVGLFFLNALIVGFGILFCFLPGIYLGVVLSLSTCLLLFQNKSVGDAIGDSFSFIKDHWWETFGVLIVIQILIGLIGFVVDLPASLYSIGSLRLDVQNQDPTEVLNVFKDPIYLLLLFISNFVKSILYMVTIVATVFIYYDIKEQKNPSTDIIDKIGAE